MSVDEEGTDDDDYGNESDFELENDFSNGEWETDTNDDNAGGVPRGVGRERRGHGSRKG